MNRVVPFEFFPVVYAMDISIPKDYVEVSFEVFWECLKNYDWKRTAYANGERYHERGKDLGIRAGRNGAPEHYLSPAVFKKL